MWHNLAQPGTTWHTFLWYNWERKKEVSSITRAEKRKGFVLYFDQIEQVSMLSDEEAGQVFKALFRCNSDEKPHTCFKNSLTEMCFSVIHSQMRRDAERYDQKCERLAKNAKQRWDASASEDGEGDADAIACYTKTKTEKAKAKKTKTEIATDGVTEKETDAMPPDVHAAPATAVASAEERARKDPRLLAEEQEEIDRAIAKGVPPSYVQIRMGRARAYARERDRPISAVLCEWWMRDKDTPTWKREARQLQTAAAKERMLAQTEMEDKEWHSLLQAHQDRLDRL